MHAKRKELTDVYFPFSELLNGDFFVLHPSLLPEGSDKETVFLKIESNKYKKIDQEDVVELKREETHRTLVSLAPTHYMF